MELTPAGGPARWRKAAAEPPVCQTSGGVRVASPQRPILRRSEGIVAQARQRTMWVGEKSGFENYRSPVLLTTTVRFCSHRDTKNLSCCNPSVIGGVFHKSEIRNPKESRIPKSEKAAARQTACVGESTPTGEVRISSFGLERPSYARRH